ncbi:hypothetical protein AUP68_16513 [Ilyonectria robusta]
MKFSATLATAAMAPLTMALSVRDPNAAWLMPRDHPEESQDNKGKGNDNNGGGGDSIVVGDGININLGGDGRGRKNDKGGSAANVIIIWVNGGNGAETTTINEKVTVTQTVTAGAGTVIETPAAAASHTVTVGGPGGLVYQPDQLNSIPIGDTVVFEFLSQNHTVSQSAFDTPCDLLEGGMDSGFMANPNNTVSPPPQVAMQVMVDTPLWFYCKQMGHCGKGMTFSINPTAEKTQAMFQALAIKQKGTGAESPITDPAASSAVVAPPAESAAPPAESAAPPVEAPASTASAPEGTEAATPGEGTMGGDGSCTCIVTCQAGSFPAEVQGLGNFGGISGKSTSLTPR